MTRARLPLALLAAAQASGCAPAPPASPAPPRADVVAAMGHVDAATGLWPGFRPDRVPVAVFDGERTLLFRHPRPPEGFVPVPGVAEAMRYPGRHPGVTANTATEIGGAVTATVLLSDAAPPPSADRLAALIVHEAFHAFREARHPDWVGNEAELFVYPVEDAALLRLRRLETEALRRALAASDAAASACWAGRAVGLRAERFAALPPGAAAYERGTELNEGLARYVERRVAPAREGEVLPPGGFAPDAVRERGYATGEALALLLDRNDPAWRDALERGEGASLDGRLASALGADGASGCGFTPAETELAAARAAADVEEHRRRTAELRRAFLAAEGWRLEVEAPDEPLWPEGFDPLNVRRLEAGEVLHSRWIRLGGAAGAVEVLGRASLSEAAGEHPLFQGVRRLVVTGLPVEPLLRDSADVLLVEADGVTARLAASAQREGRTLVLRVGR